ncbi:nitrate ABC transporter permease [Bordetella genomosp. 8]|uniref:Nitrate ABC transporter permease n=1 Tax=Bordetella genomosp. 8 TaxID=1416806 RepID=A0A1W6YGH3_9BORD|nr:ABC transporter permease subunit [Bordetella genomosp. 8]ARP80119.1 nitrate ABC transporter permease [Bordetella genomosp. 8]
MNTDNAILDRPAARKARSVSAVARLKGVLSKSTPQILFFVVLVGGWEAMARVLHSPLVPDSAAIAGELLRIVASGFAFIEIGVTFWRMSLGFLLALAIALPIGIVTALSRFAQRFFEPGIILGLTVPGLVWALLCVIWFGVSLSSPVVAVALGVLPALIISVQHGIRSLDHDLVDMVHVFRMPRAMVLRKVWLPLLYSFIISGCRVGFSIAWKVIVLVEIFGMSDGVGYQLNAQFSTQNVEGVLAWTIAFWAAMLLVEHGIFQALESHANRWKKRPRE